MTARAVGRADGPRGRKAVSAAPKTEEREKGRRRTDLDELFTADGDRVAVQRQKRQELQEQALRLLASARVEGVPPRFDGSELMLTIHYWRRERLEQRIGPEPLKADKDALGEVSAAAKRLAAKLDRLNAAMDAPASRIADSRFTAPWPRERLHDLRRELTELAVAAGSREVEEDMRRPNIRSRR